MGVQQGGGSGTTPERTTAVGVFKDRIHADRAVAELQDSGFRSDQIGVAMRHNEGDFEIDLDSEGGSEAGAGALTGALTGLGLGALTGLGVLAGMVPVIGPAIAGGTLGVILSNAAAGAGIVGLVGALIGVGIPEEEANYYLGEFEAGGTVVTVQAADRCREAEEILSRNNAYNIHSDRTAAGRMETPAPAAGVVPDTPATAQAAPPAPAGAGPRTVQVPVEREEVVEEQKSGV